MIPESRRQRFLQFPIAVRLGHLASNLGRASSFARFPASKAALSVVEESLYFIKWIAPDLSPERVDDAGRLVEIEQQLMKWYSNWGEINGDPIKRQEVVIQARAWSDEVLAMSGLLNEE